MQSIAALHLHTGYARQPDHAQHVLYGGRPADHVLPDGLTVRSLLRAGSLKRVLPDYQLQTLNVFAVYASRQYLDAKIKTWIEFLRDWTDGALDTESPAIQTTSNG